MHRRLLVNVPLAAMLAALAACSPEEESADPAAATGSPPPEATRSPEPEPASPGTEAEAETTAPETAPPEAEAEDELTEAPVPTDSGAPTETGAPQSESGAPPTETEAAPRESASAPSSPPASPPASPGTREPEAGPAAPSASAPPLGSFAGLSGGDGVFAMSVEEAYVDDDGVVTDGMGTTERAAEGSEFVVFNLRITNESSAPAYFDWGGSYAYDTAGNQYVDDFDAAWAACDSYCGDDLNPGATAETDVIFEMPEDRGIVSLELSSDPYGSGGAAVIEP
ncbi:DUF4352 domain-containing protein [Streptomonospora litoralis]|nr:DUF4352 domain-containing protein [Streptomonospora litoralis]